MKKTIRIGAFGPFLFSFFAIAPGSALALLALGTRPRSWLLWGAVFLFAMASIVGFRMRQRIAGWGIDEQGVWGFGFVEGATRWCDLDEVSIIGELTLPGLALRRGDKAVFVSAALLGIEPRRFGEVIRSLVPTVTSPASPWLRRRYTREAIRLGIDSVLFLGIHFLFSPVSYHTVVAGARDWGIEHRRPEMVCIAFAVVQLCGCMMPEGRTWFLIAWLTLAAGLWGVVDDRAFVLDQVLRKAQLSAIPIVCGVLLVAVLVTVASVIERSLEEA